MTTKDVLRGQPRGTAAEAIAALVGPDAKDIEYVNAVFANAPKVNLDPAIVFAQACQETATATGPLSSVRWNRGLNPSGIGIVADGTPQPFVIGSATEAALIHLACLNLLAVGYVDEPTSWITAISADANAWIRDVWVNQHCRYAPPVRTIADLCIHYPVGNDMQSTWAWDTQYASGIVGWGNKVFKNLPASVLLVAKPAGSPLVLFDQPRAFTLAPGAVLRKAPGRAGSPNVFVGYEHGDSVNGDDRWLTTGSTGVYVHASGVKETF